MKKRLLALTLALGMALGLLTGCSGSSDDGIPSAAKKDVVKYLTDGTLKNDEVVATVNGENVTADYYLYWVAYYIYALGLSADTIDTDTGYDATYGEYIQYAAEQAVTYYYTMSQQAEELGCTLTEDEEAQIEEGAMEGNDLLYFSTTSEAQDTIYRQYLLGNKLQEQLYGEGGEQALAEEDMESYAEENEYYTCRYILFSTMSGEDDEEQKAACQTVYDELKAADTATLEDTFQSYQEEYNVTDTNTDRFTFQSSSVVTGFAELTAELAENELGMTEEATDYGYFVVLRLPLELDDSTKETLRDDYASTAFSTQMSTWISEEEISFTEEAEGLDLTAFCTSLTELQTAIEEAEAAEEAADSSAAAEEADASTAD